MTGDWYLEIIDVRHGGHKTGKGAAWETEAEARAHFEAARPYDVGEAREFLLDLHNPNGDLLDTIRIDASVFERLVGEPPDASYAEYDRAYWREARVARTKMASPAP